MQRRDPQTRQGPAAPPVPLPATAPSRRQVLALSAAAAAAGLGAACSPGPARGAGGTNPADWTASDMTDQKGRRAIVTGGNGYPQEDRSGLGYHIALALARAGAEVTIASRNAARGAEAVRRILAEAPAGAVVRFERLDLADLASVRAFAAGQVADGRPLDLLINNAGVMGRRQREVTVDGLERVFATNTVGHFALTRALLPLMPPARRPRIVWMASLRTSDALPFDDLQGERTYDYAKAYDHSKLANLLLAFEFARRGQADGGGVATLAAHPGVARTNLIPDGPGLDSAEGLRFRTMPFLFQPPAEGALPCLYAATSDAAAAGGYYGPTGAQGLRGPPGGAKPPAAALDQPAAARLWAALERLTGAA